MLCLLAAAGTAVDEGQRASRASDGAAGQQRCTSSCWDDCNAGIRAAGAASSTATDLRAVRQGQHQDVDRTAMQTTDWTAREGEEKTREGRRPGKRATCKKIASGQGADRFMEMAIHSGAGLGCSRLGSLASTLALVARPGFGGQRGRAASSRHFSRWSHRPARELEHRWTGGLVDRHTTAVARQARVASPPSSAGGV